MLRSARRGVPVVVTSNGQPIAAVVSIGQLRSLEQARSGSLAEAVTRARANLDPDDLAGPDPWGHVRDHAPGRDVELG